MEKVFVPKTPFFFNYQNLGPSDVSEVLELNKPLFYSGTFLYELTSTSPEGRKESKGPDWRQKPFFYFIQINLACQTALFCYGAPILPLRAFLGPPWEHHSVYFPPSEPHSAS